VFLPIRVNLTLIDWQTSCGCQYLEETNER
jgi:hypothetical protein